MIAINSNYLRRSDSAMIRKYSRFVLNRLVRPCIQKRSKITIKVLGEQEIKDAADLLDLKKYKAWCTYDGLDDEGNKKFTVVLNYSRISKLGKKPQTRLKQILIDLGHELTHVKQYLNNLLSNILTPTPNHQLFKLLEPLVVSLRQY